MPIHPSLLFVPVALCAAPALAASFDEAQARSRIEAAGFTRVEAVHQGNLGEWMAEGDKDGQHALVVLHPDGRVDLRQQVQVSPVPKEPLPAPKAAQP